MGLMIPPLRAQLRAAARAVSVTVEAFTRSRVSRRGCRKGHVMVEEYPFSSCMRCSHWEWIA